MRFLHMADVHLGNQQYGHPARFNDFGRSFLDAINIGIERQVEVCIIAGDLFHKTAIDPKTLIIAEEGLTRLQQNGIPVIAVHGNHDKARYRDQFSWVEYLADRGLMKLLTPRFDVDPVSLEPETSYVDIGFTRFIGVPWLGASAGRVLAEVADCCGRLPSDGIGFTVLVTHAGIEGQMPDMSGCLTYAELRPLKNKVQYIALGHLHKPYPVENWIYNPGSLEACSFEEAAYERGVFVVEALPDGTHTADHIRIKNRPFVTLALKTDLYGDCETLNEAVRRDARHKRRDMLREVRSEQDWVKPVVRVILEGYLAFERSQLDLEHIRRLVLDEIEALLVKVDNRTRPYGYDFMAEENLSRDELERAIFEDLARSDPRYGFHAERWGDLMLHLKRLALDPQCSSQEIYAALDKCMADMEEVNRVDYPA